MDIEFEVAGHPATFTFDRVTGAARLHVDGAEVALNNLLDPRTYFSFATETVWHHDVEGHPVEIARHRERVLGGLRESDFSVAVDGQIVAEGRG